jgi:hypothetical protein
MGEIITIRDQIGPWEYRIRFNTGMEQTVSVDPDIRTQFQTVGPGGKKPVACPFLRPLSPKKQVCTVHNSRPELCRSYLCSRILILDKYGKKAGRVLSGTQIFNAENAAVLDLWNTALRNIQVPDDDAWERMVETVFVKAGYRVLR